MKFFTDSYDAREFWPVAIGCKCSLFIGLYLASQGLHLGFICLVAFLIGVLSFLLTYLVMSAWFRRMNILMSLPMFSAQYIFMANPDQNTFADRHPKIMLTIYSFFLFSFSITLWMIMTQTPLLTASMLTTVGGIGFTLIAGFILSILPPID